MTDLKDIKDREPNEETVEFLQGLLDQAKRGDLRSVAIVCGWMNDKTNRLWSIDERNSLESLSAEINLLNTDFSMVALLNDETSGVSVMLNELSN